LFVRRIAPAAVGRLSLILLADVGRLLLAGLIVDRAGPRVLVWPLCLALVGFLLPIRAGILLLALVAVLLLVRTGVLLLALVGVLLLVRAGILLLALVGVLLLVRTGVLLLALVEVLLLALRRVLRVRVRPILTLSRLILRRLLVWLLSRRRCSGILRRHAASVGGNLVARVALGLICWVIVAIAAGLRLAIILHFAVRGLLPLAPGALLVPCAVHRTIRFCPRLAPFGSISLGIVITGIPITIG
jgi:hypothetical protein